jgi:hypothetical protein
MRKHLAMVPMRVRVPAMIFRKSFIIMLAIGGLMIVLGVLPGHNPRPCGQSNHFRRLSAYSQPRARAWQAAISLPFNPKNRLAVSPISDSQK